MTLPEEPLTAATLGLLASLGLGELAVRRRPRVAILSTGNELRPPGAPLAAGQIHDANGIALAAAITEAGGEPVPLERTPDDAVRIEQQVMRGAAEADLLVASGGVSVGRHDLVRDVIERLGALDFWRIRMQPGKPLAFGAVRGVPVLGLPGNPVSALVTFELFARPLIRRMLGLSGWRSGDAAGGRPRAHAQGPGAARLPSRAAGARGRWAGGAAGRRAGIIAAATDGHRQRPAGRAGRGARRRGGADVRCAPAGSHRVTTSHLGPGGEARMVDVGDKPVTARRAVAEATVRMQPDTLATLMDAGGPKGDAFGVARLAGIGAAKRTADLIPLCHPLPLDKVEVTLTPDRAAGTVAIRAEVRVTARTGVEMEALTAASVAALTLYDMAKALQRDIVIERVALLEKEGGRSGSWSAEGEPSVPSAATHEAVVVTCSNRSAAGERDDTAGPALIEALRAAGWDPEPEAVVVPDDESAIAAVLTQPGGRRASAHPDHRGHRSEPDRRHAGGHAARRRPPGARDRRDDALRGNRLHAHGLAVAWRGGGARHDPDREPARLAEGRPRIAGRGPPGAAPRDRAAGRRRSLKARLTVRQARGAGSIWAA